MKKILKNYLWNRCQVRFWNNFTEIILGWPFSKTVCKILICQLMALVNESCLHNTDMKNLLKIFLLWNCWSDFRIILWSCSLGDLFQKLFAKLWSVKKHGSGEWGYKILLLRNSWKKKKKSYGLFRWAIQGHLGPLVSDQTVYFVFLQQTFRRVIFSRWFNITFGKESTLSQTTNFRPFET